MPPSSAQRLGLIFAGHGGGHGTHGVPVLKPGGLKWEIKGTARSLREPPTLEMWEKHVKGERPLGIIPVREDSTCSWGSIDVDEYDANLLGIILRVEQLKLKLVPCRSKSGGLHLFMFLTEPQPAGSVQAVLRDLAAQLGLAGCEIFPKQTKILSEKGDVGNWMVMPYFGSTYGGKIKDQVGLRKTGAELTVEQFCELAERSRITPEELETTGKKRTSGKVGTTQTKGGPFSDGPPCLQHLASKGIAPGGQSNALLMMGIYFKRADPAHWKERLERANQDLLQPPGSAEGLATVLRSLSKKDYEYTCRAEPMVSHCNSSLCRTRRFGVGEAGNFPIIAGLSMLDTEPPLWFVDIEDKRIEVTTEQLQNYQLFHRLCMEKVRASYMMMKMGDWLNLLRVAMADLTIIEAPPEVGTTGRFHELLTEFLTNRARGTRKEDILSGRPWEDVETMRHYFRSKDLEKFLIREGMRELSRPKIIQRIRDMGGDDWQMDIKNHNVACWFVPSEKILPAPSVGPSPMKQSPI